MREFLLLSAFPVPILGEDPKGPGLFIVMGLCVAVMAAVLVLGRKKDKPDDK